MREKNRPYRILFIGNSFTYYNKMAKRLFSRLCEVTGYDVTVEQVTKGGNSLMKQADPLDVVENPTENETGSGALVEELLSKNKYDFVIIQEQSGMPISDPDTFYKGARLLAEKVRKNGAALYFYATWGYKEGYEKLPYHGGTTEAMEMKLRAAYGTIARELGAEVCPVGAAFTDVYTNNGARINLYWRDLYHPNVAGSSLAAYTIFSKVFGVDVRGEEVNLLTADNTAPARNGGVTVLTDITVADANVLLREAAYRATLEGHLAKKEKEKQ